MKKIAWGEPPLPGEGEPASKKEVKESWKEGFYAPTEPEKAIEYYTEKRKKILHDHTLKPETKQELIEYYDRRRLFEIVENKGPYEQYYTSQHTGAVESKFIEGANNALRKLLSKEHYMCAPNTVFIAPKEHPLHGLSFRSKITGVEFYDPNQTEFRYDIELTETDKPEILHRGSVYINNRLGIIRTAIIPEGLHINNPQTSVKKQFNTSTIELEIITALANLARPIEYESRAYTGQRIAAQGRPLGTEPMEPTQIVEKKESTLPYRRREIDTIADLPQALDELLDSWTREERKKLEQAGNGDVIIRVYSHQGNQYNVIGSAPAGNMGALSGFTTHALRQGTALITFEHTWRPPEVDSLPSGAPHRPHTRRLRGEVVLVVGNAIEPEERTEILSLWKRRKGKLTDPEQQKLQDFLNKYGLNKQLEVDLVLAPGIHYKDGRFVMGSGAGVQEHEYTL